MASSKSIYISYTENDKMLAYQLKTVIEQLLGEDAWLRDFDLDGGDLIASALDEAISDAKWFIILLSHSAMASKWMRTEANLATLKSIEDLNFKIIIIQVDDTTYPPHLKIALKTQYLVDLRETKDKDGELIRIVDYINRFETTHSRFDVFVDRGEDRDKFSLMARRNRIVFLLGWAGIGKTSFVNRAITEHLGKRPLTVKISRGHSLDLFSRQILQKAHIRQPLADQEVTENVFIEMALQAISDRADRFFLFIDNAEDGLDHNNQLVPYLSVFLEAFLERGIRTHVILATTRNPDYPVPIAGSATIMHLQGLDNIYIRDCIDQWLEGDQKHDQIMRMPEISNLIDLVNGHPLAARMMASYLKVKAPQQLLVPRQRKKFQLRFAEYILRSSDKFILKDVHRSILSTLAIVREPMTMEDLLAITEVNQYDETEVYAAQWELTDWFLIEQSGELISLHGFLGIYFSDRLEGQDKLRDSIASNFAEYAYKKVMQFKSLSNIRITEVPRFMQLWLNGG